MKIETPQILWHAQEKGKAAALTSCDMLASGIALNSQHGQHNTQMLATSAAEIHLWKLQFDTDSADGCAEIDTKIEFRCALLRHEGPVSCVKFSPDGLHLVSGSETGSILVHSVPLNKRAKGNGRHFWSTVTQENDLLVKIASRCGDGVTDLSWSSDSRRLLAGTVDHAVWVFEVDTSPTSSSTWKTVYRNTSHHTHYCQGVAYDPLQAYLASMSSDRTIRILQRKLPKHCKKKILRSTANVNDDGTIQPSNAAETSQWLSENSLQVSAKTKQIKFQKASAPVVENISTTTNTNSDADDVNSTMNLTSNKHYFCDESTLNSFFRRLAWTVDGAYLIAPAALHEQKYATLLFQRHQWEQPAKILAGLDKVRYFYVDEFVIDPNTYHLQCTLFACSLLPPPFLTNSLRLRCAQIPFASCYQKMKKVRRLSYHPSIQRHQQPAKKMVHHFQLHSLTAISLLS